MTSIQIHVVLVHQSPEKLCNYGMSGSRYHNQGATHKNVVGGRCQVGNNRDTLFINTLTKWHLAYNTALLSYTDVLLLYCIT